MATRAGRASFENRGSKNPNLHEAGHLERRRDLGHLRIVVFLGLLRRVLHRREHGVADDLRVFLQEFRIEREREEFAGAVDLEFDRATTARDLDLFGFELGLERFDAALHFLRLFEEFAYTGHK